MSRDTQLKERWEKLVAILSNQFSQGEDLDLDAIICLIGVQELGKFHREFKKDEKVNLMHIAICTLLAQSGYYGLEGHDEDGWPHYRLLKPLPTFNLLEQENFLKDHILLYFESIGEPFKNF